MERQTGSVFQLLKWQDFFVVNRVHILVIKLKSFTPNVNIQKITTWQIIFKYLGKLMRINQDLEFFISR